MSHTQLSERAVFRKRFSELLVRDARRAGWRVSLDPRGRVRIVPAGPKARQLRFELRYWIKREFRRDINILLFKPPTIDQWTGGVPMPR